jgi:CheY-like chemotaxis protein
MADQKTVLFVDDEPAVLNSLKRMLREEGWNLVFVESGPKGSGYWKNRPWMS